MGFYSGQVINLTDKITQMACGYCVKMIDKYNEAREFDVKEEHRGEYVDKLQRMEVCIDIQRKIVHEAIFDSMPKLRKLFDKKEYHVELGVDVKECTLEIFINNRDGETLGNMLDNIGLTLPKGRS